MPLPAISLAVVGVSHLNHDKSKSNRRFEIALCKPGDPAEGKTVVFGMLECGGDVVTQLVPNRTRGTIFPLIKASVAPR